MATDDNAISSGQKHNIPNVDEETMFELKHNIKIQQRDDGAAAEEAIQ
jgi:hypothetical protein